MGQKKVRLVVVVRCPLCGAWIIGNAYSEHVESVHLSRAPEGLTAPALAPDTARPESEVRGWEHACGRLTPDAALDLLAELGRRRAQGQDAVFGFELFE